MGTAKYSIVQIDGEFTTKKAAFFMSEMNYSKVVFPKPKRRGNWENVAQLMCPILARRIPPHYRETRPTAEDGVAGSSLGRPSPFTPLAKRPPDPLVTPSEQECSKPSR